jgi:hypothetical protein
MKQHPNLGALTLRTTSLEGSVRDFHNRKICLAFARVDPQALESLKLL